MWSGQQLFAARLFLLSCLVYSIDTSYVDFITPTWGGSGPGGRFVIRGLGFAKNLFAHGAGNEGLGNRVSFFEEGNQVLAKDCKQHLDGSLETRIECFLPELTPGKTYRIKVWVDGVEVPDSEFRDGNPWHSRVTYRALFWATPWITGLSAISAEADSGFILTIYGKIFSTVTGDDVQTSSNGRTEKLLRVWVGPMECQLRDPNNDMEPYGVILDPEDSDFGSITCKIKGSTVGHHKIRFILQPPWGGSLPYASQIRVLDKYTYMFTTYTVINSVTPQAGSINGETELMVAGRNFDTGRTYTDAEIYVDGLPCVITSFNREESWFKCKTPAKSDDKDFYVGSRGVKFEFWVSPTYDDLEELLSLPAPDDTRWSPEARWCQAPYNRYASLMTGVFVAPGNGNYTISADGPNAKEIYLGDERIARRGKNGEAWSGVHALEKGKPYLIRVVQAEGGTGDGCLNLRISEYQTSVPHTATDNSIAEQHMIKVLSTPEPEVQNVVFNNWDGKNNNNQYEKQKVCAPDDLLFKLGLFDTYIAKKVSITQMDTLAAELNKLPVLCKDEEFRVTSAGTSGDKICDFIEIVSNRGDFDLLQVKSDGGSGAVTVNEEVQGRPDMDEFSLVMGNIPGPCLSYEGLTEEKLNDALDAMFGSTCPESLAQGADFENCDSRYGEAVKDVPAFCGRCSLKNPESVFPIDGNSKSFSLSRKNYVCFAHKGAIREALWLSYSYKSLDEASKLKTNDVGNKYFEVQFNKDDSEEKWDKWFYSCFNLEEIITKHPFHASTDQSFTIDKIVIKKETDEDIFVDSVYFGDEPTVPDTEAAPSMVLKQAAPVAKAVMETVTATYNESTNTATITMQPFHCASNFQLFSLLNRQASSSGPIILRNRPATSSAETTVTRETSATPALSGNIVVKYQGYTAEIDVTGDNNYWRTQLEGMPSVGTVELERQSYSSCAKIFMRVEFVSKPGDIDLMEVTYDDVGPVGTTASVEETRKGRYSHSPPSELMFMAETKPQVTVRINDVLCKCDGDCSFEWTSGSTPTVASFSPESGKESDTLTIDGAFLSSEEADFTVSVGDVPCAVTSASASQIECTLGAGSAGTLDVYVDVVGFGRATLAETKFTLKQELNSFEPQESSLGGGIIMTINGFGFTSSDVIMIGSKECLKPVVETTKITCVVPKTDSTSTVMEAVKVGITTSTASFTYKEELTSQIDTVDPQQLWIHSGQEVTLTGQFKPKGDNPSFFIGDSEVTITSISTTEIKGTTGVLTPGNPSVYLDVDGNGHAINGNDEIPTVQVELKITDWSPLKVSQRGGADLYIAGSGFGADLDQVDVTIEVSDEDQYECQPKTVSDTLIVCEIEDTAKTHTVTNNIETEDPSLYNDFDQRFVSIVVGDCLLWTWRTPDFLGDLLRKLVQVKASGVYEPKENGIDSGTPIKNGQYKWCFHKVGQYHFSSGYVDAAKMVIYFMTVEVKPKPAMVGQINVKISNKSPIHEIASAGNEGMNDACSPEVNPLPECTDGSLPTPADANKGHIFFLKCHTSVVEIVKGKNDETGNIITLDASIRIEGKGFSSEKCNIDVLVDQFPCLVKDDPAPTDTSFECIVDQNSEPQMMRYYEVNVNVQGGGTASKQTVNPKDRYVAFRPSVTEILGGPGSLKGGTDVVIQGLGFSPSGTQVSFNAAIVDCQTPTYTEIICTSPPSTSTTDGSATVEVTVDGTLAVCTKSAGCTFQYRQASTPTVTAIVPNVIATVAEKNVVITGTLFGEDKDKVTVSIGGVNCEVDSVEATSISCNIGGVPAGTYRPLVVIVGKGMADSGDVEVDSTLTLSVVSPPEGSIYGETLITLTGHGFKDGDTTVTVGGETCTQTTPATISTIVCTTAANDKADNVLVTVESSDGQNVQIDFGYSDSATPKVADIEKTSGNAGDAIIITGSSFGDDVDKVTVDLSGTECAVIGPVTDSRMSCTVGVHPSLGSVNVQVHVAGKGNSNSNVTFTYELSIASFSPMEGDVRGNQYIEVSATGVDETTSLTMCGEMCTFERTLSPGTHRYLTPMMDEEANCTLKAVHGSQSDETADEYAFREDLSPTVTGVTPARGGTGGGTVIQITGTRFGNNMATISVTIDGTACIVTDVTDTAIQCTTSSNGRSVSTKVVVVREGVGIALEETTGDSTFEYVDLWSSPATWGGNPPPEEGEIVVIPKGISILLDVDTPVLKMILIQGGALIFDDRDLELSTYFILITSGGKMQVGTEDRPYRYVATIRIHGKMKGTELPIFGKKVIAVREGTLDIHGIPTPRTWTRLRTTAAAGSDTLFLQEPLECTRGGGQLGDVIIATTGDRFSFNQSEVHTIRESQDGGSTLILTTPLQYEHLGVSVPLPDGRKYEVRAEVGCRTRNIRIEGVSDIEWNDIIKACSSDFNPGEFSVSPCYAGRYGEEVGSDEHGAHIMLHAPEQDKQLVTGRLSYVEITHAGQAFQLGRYPVHFHLNGDMSGSYVRGCAIHDTFNRAINIHDTHKVKLEGNVADTIMGGSIFLEDGVEIDNIIQNNLVVGTKSSSSLLSEDATPASFWVTNPNNVVVNNVAAGSSHFGFWPRLRDKPDGPSAVYSHITPSNTPNGRFENNTAHSCGRFCFWVHQSWVPTIGGGRTRSISTAEPAVYEGLLAYRCDKGIEFNEVGVLSLQNSIVAENNVNFERKTTPYTHPDGHSRGDITYPGLKNVAIIASTSETGTRDTMKDCTGIKLPFGHGFSVDGAIFMNFDKNGCTAFKNTKIIGTSGPDNGGFSHKVSGLRFESSVNKVAYDWHHQFILNDVDGSIHGEGYTIVPASNTIPTDCVDVSGIKPAGKACPPKYAWHRFAANDGPPTKDMLLTNTYGADTITFQHKRISHQFGWMAMLLDGVKYRVNFIDAEVPTNFTLKMMLSGYRDGDHCNIFEFEIYPEPDVLSDSGVKGNRTTGELSCDSSAHMDWNYNGDGVVNVVVKPPFVDGHVGTEPFRDGKVGALTTTPYDVLIDLKIYKCHFERCEPATPKDEKEPLSARPDWYIDWDSDIWERDGIHLWCNNSETKSTSTRPEDGDIVFIHEDVWIVASSSLKLDLKQLLLEGVLEFDYAEGLEFELSAENILIQGGRLLAGWQNNPFSGSLTMRLIDTGEGTEDRMTIGVFGGLDLIGKDFGDTSVLLTQTANPGDKDLHVDGDISGWNVGDMLMVTTTTFEPSQSERHEIKSITGQTIELKQNLQYPHLVDSVTTTSGEIIKFQAAVARLSRNIKIEPANKAQAETRAVGPTIRVTTGQDEAGNVVTGWARLKNVECHLCGQFGWADRKDPRFSLAFFNVVPVSDIKPSKVTGCSFDMNLSPAMGLFGVTALVVENNVFYRSLGSTVVIESKDVTFQNNIIAKVECKEAARGNRDEFSEEYDSGVEAMAATDFTMKDNLVAGSERCGYHVRGEDCSAAESNFADNMVVGSLMGVCFFPVDAERGPRLSCMRFSGYKAWKITDSGFYYNSPMSVEVHRFISADMGSIGVFTMVISPSSVLHICGSQYTEVKHSKFIGKTPSFDCTKDVPPAATEVYMQLSEQHRGFKGPDGSTVAVVLPTFTSNTNNAPLKGCFNIMAYNGLCGQGRVEDTEFISFRDDACSAATMIGTNPNNDDLLHPIYTSNIKIKDSEDNQKVYMHRPNHGLINPSDCVDMDCDGLKKSLIRDLDGTLLGVPGSYIPQSEHSWNGGVDPTDDIRDIGLGDIRIPKPMQTGANGDRIPKNDIAPYNGIIRTGNCTLVTKGTSAHYECRYLQYELLNIESMDADSETRRLSPVAILGDGFVDLVNGPQDHGWCAGYTCQKRLSIFYALVLSGEYYKIYLTSTPPETMRFRLLNEAQGKILVSYYHPSPVRLDLKKDGKFILPTNGYINEEGEFALRHDPAADYNPKLTDPAGTYFVDRLAKEIHFVMDGNSVYDVVRTEQVVISLSLPQVHINDFFNEENLVRNIAALLEVPPSMVRIARIVAENAVVVRRRRSTTGIIVEVEVGPPPPDVDPTAPTESNATELADISMQKCQSGSLQTIGSYNASCDAVAVDEVTYTPEIPETLALTVQPTSQHEGVPFSVQPQLRAYDSEGNAVQNLGIAEMPYQCTVTLVPGLGHENATLEGTTTVGATAGVFVYTDLRVTHAGDYKLDFAVSDPAAFSYLTARSEEFTVQARPLTLAVYSSTSRIVQNQPFSFSYEVKDAITADTIENINWRGHTFELDCDLAVPLPSVTLTGGLTPRFDTANGRADLSDIAFSGYGPVALTCHVTSSPQEYDFKFSHLLYVIGESQTNTSTQSTERVQFKISKDYDSYVDSEEKKFKLMMVLAQDFASIFPKTIFTEVGIEKGSILVTFTIEGSSADVQETMKKMCEDVASLSSLNFEGEYLTFDKYMTVDGATYYGVGCAASSDEGGLHPAVIAVLAVLGAIILATIVFFIVYRLKIKPKAKTHVTDVRPSSSDPERNNTRPYQKGFYYMDNGKRVFLGNPDKPIGEMMYKPRGAESKAIAPTSHIIYDVPKQPDGRMPRPPSNADLYSQRELTLSVLPATPRDWEPTPDYE